MASQHPPIREFSATLPEPLAQADDLLFQAITENLYSDYSHADIDNVVLTSGI